ncbi:Acetyltransferase, gnat family protein [Minicystis rosea]|nr:Acetyltransferase, gnat family protein [Minicystis rosea]
MKIERAGAFSPTALTELWNLGYTGYFVPVQFTEALFAQHVRAGNIDLDSSLVLVDGEAPAAFSFLGRRGERGWIGGVGVVPTHRGKGIAHELFAEHMSLARRVGLTRVVLEVLRQNWAQKVYARAGFATTRNLMMLAGTLPRAASAAEGVRTVTEEAFFAHHARLHAAFPACWQREVESLQAASTPGAIEVLALGPADAPTGMLMLGMQNGAVRIRDGAALDEAAAEVLLAAVSARYPGASLTLVNEPEGSPLHRVLLAMGFVEKLVQHEMVWTGSSTCLPEHG